MCSFNGDVSAWNVQAVTTMNVMFWDDISFNGDLCPWKDAFATSGITAANMVLYKPHVLDGLVRVLGGGFHRDRDHVHVLGLLREKVQPDES